MSIVRNIRILLLSMRLLNGVIACLSVLMFAQLLQGVAFQFSYLLGMYMVGILMSMSGGYLINDFYDVQTDRVNRPHQNKLIKKWSFIGFLTFGILVAILAIFLALIFNQLAYGYVLLLSVFLVWIYSYYFQKIAIVGNLVVVLLTLLLYFPIWWEEGVAIIARDEIIGFLILTAIITFTREIIKDAEDKLGDELSGYRTLPILIPSKWIQRITEILVILALVSLFIAFRWWMHPGGIQLVSIPVYAILFGFIVSSWRTNKQNATPQFFGRQSQRLKWAMLFFLLYIMWLV
jgi:4-hydroxybenzoate polyprenyltransferase